jgi:hypothetical protein
MYMMQQANQIRVRNGNGMGRPLPALGKTPPAQGFSFHFPQHIFNADQPLIHLMQKFRLPPLEGVPFLFEFQSFFGPPLRTFDGPVYKNSRDDQQGNRNHKEYEGNKLIEGIHQGKNHPIHLLFLQLLSVGVIFELAPVRRSFQLPGKGKRSPRDRPHAESSPARPAKKQGFMAGPACAVHTLRTCCFAAPLSKKYMYEK